MNSECQIRLMSMSNSITKEVINLKPNIYAAPQVLSLPQPARKFTFCCGFLAFLCGRVVMIKVLVKMEGCQPQIKATSRPRGRVKGT